MTQPTAYTPVTDFSDDERANTGGRSTVRTAALDAEFSAIAATLSGVRANLALNQRDDGEIRDDRVKLHTLAADVRALLSAGQGVPRGAWGTATAYALRDMVTQGGNTYICATAHTSGTFATDLSAVKWLLLTLGAAAAASSIPFTPTANIGATNVQAAIDEADTAGRALSASLAVAAAAAVAALSADLADSATAGKGANLVAFNGQLNYAVGTIGYRERLSVYVEDYGAVPDWNGSTGTDNASAINAAIAAVGTVARKGGQVVLTGRYKILSQISNPYQGVYLVGKGGRRTAITQIHNANTSGGHAVHFGDVAETSPDASHLDAQGISGIYITGNASSGCGIRAYNTTIRCVDVGVFGHGSYGVYTDTCYLSSFQDCCFQANGNSQFYSKTALNAVTFIGVSFLSAPTKIGLEISPGIKGTNGCTLIGCDFEGLLWGVYLDCTLGSIKDFTMMGTNFESNSGFGVKQSATGNVTGLTIIGGGYYQAGSGISLGAVYGGQITGATLTDCNIDISSDNGVLIVNPVLQGTATINAGTVLSKTIGTYPNGSLVTGGSARSPLQTRIGGAWMPVEPVMNTAATVATVGAAAYAMDLSAGNCFMLTLSAAATSLTLTATSDTAPTGAEATVMVYNGGTATAGGAVTIPTGWKKSAALVIPSINTMSTFRFRKDGNGNWWESSRVVNVG